MKATDPVVLARINVARDAALAASKARECLDFEDRVVRLENAVVYLATGGGDVGLDDINQLTHDILERRRAALEAAARVVEEAARSQE